MKKNTVFKLIMVGLVFGGSLLVGSQVFAFQEMSGGSSAGSGSVPICSADYTSIHEPSCGKDGGGASWRVYKVKKNSTVSNLDDGATWKIRNASPKKYGGKSIKSILERCVKEGTSYILIYGLNRVAVANVTKYFYVAFGRQKVDGKCRNNRGCYYDPNTYKQITKASQLKSAKNGRIVEADLAKRLYKAWKKESEGTTSGYTKAGAFCTNGNEDPEPKYYDVIAYAKDITTGALLNNGKSIDRDNDDLESGDEGIVDNVQWNKPDKYDFVKWTNCDREVSYYGEDSKVECYATVKKSNVNVYAWYKEKPKYTLTVRAVDAYTKEVLDSESKTGYRDSTVSLKGSFSIPSGYQSKGQIDGPNNVCTVNGVNISCKKENINQNITVTIYYDRKYSLTAYACNASNNNAKMNGGKAIDGPKTVWRGSKASVSSANYNPAGYSWKGWSGACSGTDRTCTVNPLLENKTACAQYLRNRFGGRAYAKNASYGSDVADTGYVTDSATSSKDTDCETDGCKINFGVFLKRYDGNGKAEFSTNAKPSKESPYKPSTNGEQVGGTESQVIKPGEQACRYIKFRPYGTYSDGTEKTAKSCMTAKVTYFDARIKLSGSLEKDTSWQGSNGSNKSYTYYASNCTYGCKVSFNHQMRKTNSIGSIDYTVSRESNLTDSNAKPRRITSNSKLAAGKFDGKAKTNSGATIKDDNNLVLYPGMKVCEKVAFKPNNKPSTSKNVVISVCVYANGNAQPPDPGDSGNPGNPDDPEPPTQTFTGGDAFVNIKVRNKNVAAYSNYQREVYAKPGSIDPNGGADKKGDTVAFRASYNPVLQYTYYLIPDKIRINSGSVITNSGKHKLGNLFNQNRGSLAVWNNGFSILDSQKKLISGQTYKYKAGTFSRQSPNPNERTIGPSNVGSTLSETARTSYDSETQTSPRQVAFSSSTNSTQVGNIDPNSKERTAYVRVPYNYINTTEMDVPENQVYYVGEDGQAKITIHTKPRRNNLTDGTYATRVDGAKWKMRVCFNGDCYETAPVELGGTQGMLNGSGKIRGDDKQQTIPFVVPDISAGSQICLSSAVFPADSGAENNYYDKLGNKRWSEWSAPACVRVAKRPSIQVWGGNVFSGGSLVGGLSKKKHLHGYNNYQVQNMSNPPYIFGSWGELGIVSRGNVRGFASGATLGYASNDQSGNLYPFPYKSRLDSIPNMIRDGGDPGGSRVNDFCKLSLLTIANNNCSSGAASGTGDRDATDGIKIDKDAMEGFATSGITEQGIPGNRISLTNAADGVLYSSNGDVEVQGGSLSKNALKIVSSKGGNITISGNIQINDSETFEKFSHSPKVVIYANKTIFINCNVTRIDALLVARDVVTCNNLGDGNSIESRVGKKINERSNSNQLVVNGAIVANRLYANRTYGAAKGVNSIVPAEIINFDPILYLWGGVASDNGNGGQGNNKVINGNMEVTYIHEIAPRY